MHSSHPKIYLVELTQGSLVSSICLIYGGFLPSLLSSIKFECEYKQHEANKRLGRWGAGMDTQRQW